MWTANYREELRSLALVRKEEAKERIIDGISKGDVESFRSTFVPLIGGNDNSEFEQSSV